MKFIKKIFAFILLVIFNILNGGLSIAAAILPHITPGISIFTVWFAIYVYFKDGFVASTILPVLVVAFLIATIGLILPPFVKGTKEFEHILHDYVFSHKSINSKKTTNQKPVIDYTNDAVMHKLMLHKIQ